METDVGPSDSNLNINGRLQDIRPESVDHSSTVSTTISSCDFSDEKSAS